MNQRTAKLQNLKTNFILPVTLISSFRLKITISTSSHVKKLPVNRFPGDL
jgi:hypothetical protein